jgi:hypothetical protein
VEESVISEVKKTKNIFYWVDNGMVIVYPAISGKPVTIYQAPEKMLTGQIEPLYLVKEGIIMADQMFSFDPTTGIINNIGIVIDPEEVKEKINNFLKKRREKIQSNKPQEMRQRWLSKKEVRVNKINEIKEKRRIRRRNRRENK